MKLRITLQLATVSLSLHLALFEKSISNPLQLYKRFASKIQQKVKHLVKKATFEDYFSMKYIYELTISSSNEVLCSYSLLGKTIHGHFETIFKKKFVFILKRQKSTFNFRVSLLLDFSFQSWFDTKMFACNKLESQNKHFIFEKENLTNKDISQVNI